MWHNGYITANNESLCWKTWCHAGIVYVNDIPHPTLPRFLSHEELTEKYGVKCSFLNISQIRSSLPYAWRNLIQNSAQSSITPKLQIRTSEGNLLAIENTSPRRLYSVLIITKLQKVAAQAKWNLEFAPRQGTPQQEYWESIYKSPFRCTRETKLQSFQFKLLHRILPCNKYLMNIRIRDTDLCEFCNVSDTLTHFFFYCQKVVTFWHSLCHWFARQVDTHLNHIQCRDFLFGVPVEDPQSRIINFILINTRFYIYQQRLYHNSALDITASLREFRYL